MDDDNSEYRPLLGEGDPLIIPRTVSGRASKRRQPVEKMNSVGQAWKQACATMPLVKFTDNALKKHFLIPNGAQLQWYPDLHSMLCLKCGQHNKATFTSILKHNCSNTRFTREWKEILLSVVGCLYMVHTCRKESYTCLIKPYFRLYGWHLSVSFFLNLSFHMYQYPS